MNNDLWQTPDWLFRYLNKRYGPFDVDLAASAENTKCEKFIDIQTNALCEGWLSYGEKAFCNPPYSNLSPWLERAAAYTGDCAWPFTSTWILPAWNGEKYWRPYVFQAAKEILLVFGRVAFIDPGGTVIVHYEVGYTPARCADVFLLDRDEIQK